MIRLDFADLKYSPPKEVLEKISSIDLNYYPEAGYVKLRQAIADYVGLKKENVLCGNGGDEVIDLITRVYGDVVLIPIPTFYQFKLAAQRRKSKILEAGCFENGKYELNFDQSALKQATLVWICNPNNPTGTKIGRQKIIEILEKTDAMVVVDECYYEYLGETIVDLIEKYKNLIILRSFSKNFAIAGLRLGYALSKPENIKQLEKVRQIFNVNRIAAEIAPMLFEHLDYYKEMWKKIETTKEFFSKEISEMGLTTLQSYTNFVLVKFKDMAQARRVYEGLKQRNIFVFPGWHFEFSGLEGPYMRFTIGTEKEMKSTLNVLHELLE